MVIGRPQAESHVFDGSCSENSAALARVMRISLSASDSDCPEPTVVQFRSVCSDIENKTKDVDEKSDFMYRYESSLWTMSCARPGTDSFDTARKKIALMWGAHYDQFKCVTIGLDSGDLLKYAVKKDFTEFILDVAKNYKLNINRIDRADGTTVLDYVQAEIAKARQSDKSADYIRHLESVYKQLRNELGARHRTELPAGAI